MILSYNECIEKYGSNYKLEKAIEDGKLYKIEKGIYSEKPYVDELEIIGKKYKNAIMTMNSAFYYYNLTDTIPDNYYLNTDRDSSKIKDKRVKQCFCPKELLEVGKTKINYQNVDIEIYDQERMLIELVRNKNKLPFDYYKEIIIEYRKRIDRLNIERLERYIDLFPKSNKISEIIQMEVF